VGTAQIYDLLGRFVEGDVTEDELMLLEALCDMVRNTSLCGLGQAAPNPVLSTLRYFRQEYLDQIAANAEPEPAVNGYSAVVGD
jgi:bidirectional [NiFe] hydrogenase diaphorase subunit